MAVSPKPNDSVGQVVSIIASIVFGTLGTIFAIIALSEPVREHVIVCAVALSVIALTAIYIYAHTPLSVSQKVSAWVMICGIIALSALLIIGMPVIVSLNGYSDTSGSTPPPALPPTTWRPILKQTAPYCDKVGGATWFPHSRETAFSCNASSLTMWQQEPPTQHPYFGEVDLETVQGNFYNQTNFRTTVQIKFLNISDSSSWVGVIVQTPQKRGVTGGYTLLLNSSGECDLYYTPYLSSSETKVVPSAYVNIDPSQPITMTLIVRNNVLYGYINDHLALWYRDDPNSLAPAPLEMGLVAQQFTQSVSSKIQYSNLELDEAV